MFVSFQKLSPGLTVLFLLLLISSSGLFAEPEHEDYGIDLDESLTLSALVDTALKRHPQAGVLQAGRVRVSAETDFGQRWFPEAMEVGGFHLSDRQLDDTGVYENEVALSMPIVASG